jgi:hypothetical protein
MLIRNVISKEKVKSAKSGKAQISHSLLLITVLGSILASEDTIMLNTISKIKPIWLYCIY